MNEIEETSSQEVKTGKELIIDYLTGSHEFLCNDDEVELDALGNEIKAGHACFGTPIVIAAGKRVI